jgi:hypothetical protein
MTSAQKKTVLDLVKKLTPTEVHLGDCVGADEDFYHMVRGQCIKLIGHVPDNVSKRALLEYTERRLPLPYLQRNHELVDESDILIATPKESVEQLRSGTWATIRYAKKCELKIYVVLPDGRSVE